MSGQGRFTERNAGSWFERFAAAWREQACAAPLLRRGTSDSAGSSRTECRKLSSGGPLLDAG
jgi:hypothetical protein